MRHGTLPSLVRAFVAATAIGLPALLVSAPAWAANDYYTGAYATQGEHGCDFASGQGVNPYGGCTPGVFGLLHSTAFVNGVSALNFSSASADLAQAKLQAVSEFTVQSGNVAEGRSNLFDTFTVSGDLSTPRPLTVTMNINSKLQGNVNYADWVPGWTFVYGWLRVGLVNFSDYDASFSRLGGDGDGPHQDVISRTIVLDDQHRVFNVTGVLSSNSAALHLVSADAWISFDVPVGLTLTSASGVFGSAVPEPGTWALFACGLLAIRRRAQKLVRR